MTCAASGDILAPQTQQRHKAVSVQGITTTTECQI